MPPLAHDAEEVQNFISTLRRKSGWGPDWVEIMTAFDTFPLGQPAFITHILDRAAHLRATTRNCWRWSNARTPAPMWCTATRWW